MGLNDLRLNRFIVSELYKDKLVLIPERKNYDHLQSATLTEKTSIRFLGGNRQKIGIFIRHTTDAYFSDEQLDWFQKMLQACKLNMGDVAILNITTLPFSFQEIQDELKFSRIIFLGVSSDELELPGMEEFKQLHHNDCSFLSVPAISELMKSTREGKLLKSKLWVCLQKLFDIS